MNSGEVFSNHGNTAGPGGGGFLSPMVSMAYRATGADATLLDLGHSWNEKIRIITRGWLMLIVMLINFACSVGALLLIFDPKSENPWLYYPTSIALGATWSLIFFNLSRFVITAVKASDGQPGLRAREMISLAFQIIGSALICFSIAVPATIMLLRDEIKAEITDRQVIAADNLVSAVDARFDPILDTLYVERVRLSIELKSTQEKLARLASLSLHAPQHTTETKRLEETLSNITKRAEEIQSKTKAVRAEAAAAKENILNDTQHGEGLWTNANKVLLKAPWTIFYVGLLILILQTAPLIVRAISAEGPYDLAVNLQNEITYSKYGILRMADSVKDRRGTQHTFDVFVVPNLIEKNEVKNLRNLTKKNADLGLEKFLKRRV